MKSSPKSIQSSYYAKRVIQVYKSIQWISINELTSNLTHQDLRPNQTESENLIPSGIWTHALINQWRVSSPTVATRDAVLTTLNTFDSASDRRELDSSSIYKLKFLILQFDQWFFDDWIKKQFNISVYRTHLLITARHFPAGCLLRNLVALHQAKSAEIPIFITRSDTSTVNAGTSLKRPKTCCSSQSYRYRRGSSGFDSRADRIGHNLANGSPPLRCFFGAAMTRR